LFLPILFYFDCKGNIFIPKNKMIASVPSFRFSGAIPVPVAERRSAVRKKPPVEALELKGLDVYAVIAIHLSVGT